MPFTEHQLSIPSQNISLLDPMWAEATLEGVMRVLEVDRQEAERQFCDIVRLAIVNEVCHYGPAATTQQVLWAHDTHIVRLWRMRPGSGYKPINVGTPDELPGEQGNPGQHDVRGFAIQLGKEARFDEALAAARAKTNAVVAAERNLREPDGSLRAENDPKVVRVAIGDRLQALKDELSGAAAANRARNKPPAPVGRPEGRP